MSKHTHKSLTLKEFRLQFGSEEKCLAYLSEQKWNDSTPYKCLKCGHAYYGRGKKPFSRRCSCCGYDESPTVNTLFHNVKFSLVRAFEIIYRVALNKKGASTLGLSRELGLSQHTCWYFRRRIQHALCKKIFYGKFTGKVQVDEYLVGGREEEAKGRAFGKKRKVLIITEVIEKQENGINKEVVGNQVMFHIETFRKQEIMPLIESAVDKEEAVLQTDEFKTYISMREKDGWAVDANKSQKGTWQPQIHCQIMNFKNWLRGIHHKCDSKYLQDYLNEFCYRFNRRNKLHSIVFGTLKRFAFGQPILHTQLIRKNYLAI